MTELREWIGELTRWSSGLGMTDDRRQLMTRMIEKVDQIEKRLAADSKPPKVLIAVHESANSVVVTCTAPVTVVVADHRPSAQDRLSVNQGSPMAIPAEFIEAVSDEIAMYLPADKAGKLFRLIEML